MNTLKSFLTVENKKKWKSYISQSTPTYYLIDLDHSRSLLAGAKFSRANVSRLFKGLKSYIYSSAFYVGIWAIYLVFLINAFIDSFF